MYALWQGSRMKYACFAAPLILGLAPVGTNIVRPLFATRSNAVIYTSFDLVRMDTYCNGIHEHSTTALFMP